MIPIIVVTGPTASGKTALSIALAKRHKTEIVCADSMQIYKYMNIATAKPTIDEMQGVKHHIVDFLEPGESFSVAEYVKLAHSVIADIYGRGMTPIICGGTGLYISSLIDNLQFEETNPDLLLRSDLRKIADEKGGNALLEILREFDPESADRLHENNLSRIIRAIEIYKTSGVTMSEQIKTSRLQESPYQPCMIGINYRDRQKLYERINLRVDNMVYNGLLEEAERFVKNHDLATSRQAIGYKELEPYFNGDATLDECLDALKASTRRYAKRQLTWLRRDGRINWIYPDEFQSFEELVDKADDIIRSSGIEVAE